MNSLQKFKSLQGLKLEYELYELLSGVNDSIVLTLDTTRRSRLHVYYKRHCAQSVINNMNIYSDGYLTILVEKDYDLQKIIYRIPGEGLFCKKEELNILYKILDEVTT